MEALALLIGFAAGLFVGHQLSVCKFIGNADQPMRILHRGEFYKVYRLAPDGDGVHSDPGGHLEREPRCRHG